MWFFMKKNFLLNWKIVEGEENISSKPSTSTSHLQNQENFEMEPRSKRARVENDFGPNYYVFNIEKNPQKLKKKNRFNITWCYILERDYKWWDKISNI